MQIGANTPITQTKNPRNPVLNQAGFLQILDDGYLGKRANGAYGVSTLGAELESMVIKVLEGLKPNRIKIPGHLVPRRHTAPGGMVIVNFVDPKKRLPKVSIISRMKGKESHFKTGNLENAIYNAGESVLSGLSSLCLKGPSLGFEGQTVLLKSIDLKR